MIESLLNLIFDRAHPVGSYYWSSDSTNPSKLFGGTWIQVTDRFVLAAGSTYKVGATGGNATHTLSISEIPAHSHQINTRSNSGSGNVYTIETVGPTKQAPSFYTEGRGDGKPHNNMPPYVVAYCWRRTA